MQKLVGFLASLSVILLLAGGCGLLPKPGAVPTVTPRISTASPPPSGSPAPALTPTDLPSVKPANTLSQGSEMDPQVAIVVNGRTISRDEYLAALQGEYDAFAAHTGFQASDIAEVTSYLNDKVRDQLINRILVQQAALSLGIAITQEQLNAEIASLRGTDEQEFQAWLQDNQLTESQLTAQYADQMLALAVRDAVTKDTAREQPHRHVRYLVTSSLEQAQLAREALNAGSDFAEVTRQYSSDISLHASGGDVGFIPRGILPEAADQAAFTLAEDAISDVVLTASGFYIVQVLEIDISRPVSEDYWPFVLQNAFQSWLANERSQAEIAINPVVE